MRPAGPTCVATLRAAAVVSQHSDDEMEYHASIDRLFVVFSVCWYLSAIPILWSKWSGSLWSQWQAHRIITNAPNADGSFNAYSDELEPADKSDSIDKPRPAPPKDFPKISPMRFLDWQRELNLARAHRPIKLTIFLASLPGAIYALAWALLWAARGFKSQ